VRTDGRTDGHDEANNRFSQFCERALKALYLAITWVAAPSRVGLTQRVVQITRMSQMHTEFYFEYVKRRNYLG
jgi:hypothetical protein